MKYMQSDTFYNRPLSDFHFMISDISVEEKNKRFAHMWYEWIMSLTPQERNQLAEDNHKFWNPVR